MPVQQDFFVAQRCDFSSFEKKVISERMLIQSLLLYTQTFTYHQWISLQKCFQNNKSRKTLVSLLELTDNVKICSQVYHQISSVTTDSIWGTPVHADINCCYYVHHGQDREKVL